MTRGTPIEARHVRHLPTLVVLGHAGPRPVHVVTGVDPDAPEVYIVTVYEPSPDRFEPDLRTRRRR
jgi:hypothetical protein